MDATLSLGLPRLNRSGTLLEGIQLWNELKPQLTVEAVVERALAYCDMAVAQGIGAIRSHVDVCDDRLTGVEGLLEVQPAGGTLPGRCSWWRFRRTGSTARPAPAPTSLRALDLGVDMVGGIPHFERTMEDGRRSVVELCELAAARGLMVDLHCDETDDPLSRHIETLAAETQRLGLAGRVAGSHLTSMHSMDNYYVSKLIPLIAEAGVAAIANPLINITLQGRHDTYPKRRGMTRVAELQAAGVTVAFGHDCVMDPWYSLGSGDMLEVAHMAVHVGQLTSRGRRCARCFQAVTAEPAAIMGLEGYGLEPGCRADLVVLEAGDPIEAIRLKAARLFVLRRRPDRRPVLAALGPARSAGPATRGELPAPAAGRLNRLTADQPARQRVDPRLGMTTDEGERRAAARSRSMDHSPPDPTARGRPPTRGR